MTDTAANAPETGALKRLAHWAQQRWRGIILFVPFAWLLLFFLAPFFIVAKISLAELAIASPPFTKMIEWADGGIVTIRLVFDNFIFIFDIHFQKMGH